MRHRCSGKQKKCSTLFAESRSRRLPFLLGATVREYLRRSVLYKLVIVPISLIPEIYLHA
jgi:hypothetical protein